MMKFVKTFLLCCIYAIFDLIQFFIHVRSFNFNAKIRNRLLKADTGSLTSILQSSKRLPTHIAIIFSEDLSEHSRLSKQLCVILDYIFTLGIPSVSIYDYKGVMKTRATELQRMCSDMFGSRVIVYVPGKLTDSAVTEARAQHNVLVLDASDGQKSLARLPSLLDAPASIQQLEKRVTDQLGVGEPQLVLLLGAICSSVGYPPWHLRLAEMQHIPSLEPTTLQLDQAFLRFAKCEMRLGT